MKRKDVIRDVLQAASDFGDRQLWRRFTNFDCFAVRVSGQDESMLGVVMGDGGEEFGLSLFRGPKAADSLAALQHPDGPGDDALEDLDMLGFTMEAFGNLPPEGKAFIRKAGRRPRHDEQVPSFLVKPPGRQARLPDRSELAQVLLILRAAVEADRQKLLQPGRLGSRDGICVLALGDTPTAPQVSVTQEQWQPHDIPKAAIFPSESFDLAGLPKLHETWLVGTPALPAGIEGDDRTLQLLLVAEKASGYVLQARSVLAEEPQEAVKSMVETFHGGGSDGRKGLPRKIVFSSRKLHDAMAPTLEQAGVKCIYKVAIPELQRIATDFFEHLGGGVPPFADHMEAPSTQEAEMPAPDDLAGWKDTDSRLTERFVEQMREKQFWSARAMKRYFDTDDAESLLADNESRAVAQAYTIWAILDYRPSRSSKTRAEKMLAEGLPEPESALLRARMEAHPSLYRVASHDPKAGTVVLEDVLLGGEVTVHDQLFSENIEDGVLFAVRVFQAGRFHFFDPIGPPLGALMGAEAAEFLQDCGVSFTKEGLRRDAHIFGALWDWLDQWEANQKPPRLCNTDGDELLWHTAAFSVEDPQKVRAALAKRKDIDYDEDEDEYSWIRHDKNNPKVLRDILRLGRIEFVSDEVVLTVNSAKRLTAARKWLEKLPGVAFVGVTTRHWDESAKDRPLDDRISGPDPVEMTPDLTASVQEMMSKHYMGWLDTPLPALGGKTPREACRAPEGRQQVTMLIRTIPDPMGPAPVKVPRQAMLRELGLTVESSPKKPLSVPAVAASPSGKVGRNAPCPCGSGKKYKKCCGRKSEQR